MGLVGFDEAYTYILLGGMWLLGGIGLLCYALMITAYHLFIQWHSVALGTGSL